MKKRLGDGAVGARAADSTPRRRSLGGRAGQQPMASWTLDEKPDDDWTLERVRYRDPRFHRFAPPCGSAMARRQIILARFERNRTPRSSTAYAYIRASNEAQRMPTIYNSEPLASRCCSGALPAMIGPRPDVPSRSLVRHSCRRRRGLAPHCVQAR